LLRLLFGRKRKPREIAPEIEDIGDCDAISSHSNLDTDQSADGDGGAAPFDRTQNPVKARKQGDRASLDDVVVVDTDENGKRPHRRRRRPYEQWIVAGIVTFVVAIGLVVSITRFSSPAANQYALFLAAYALLAGIIGVAVTRSPAGWIAWFSMSMFVVVIWWYFIGWQTLPERDKARCEGWWARWVFTWHVDPQLPCLIVGPDGEAQRAPDTPIRADQSELVKWVVPTYRDFVLENKFRALNIDYSVNGGSNLNTGNNLLGLYERESANNRHVEAGVHFLLAGSNGDFDARELYRELVLSEAQQKEAQTSFEGIYKLNGGEGYFRLGQMYLADDALRLPDNPYYAYYPSDEPPYSIHYPDFGVNFLGRDPDHSKAYINMQIAVLCGVTDAIEWRRYIEEIGNVSSRREALRRQAAQELDAASKITDGGFEAYCAGENLRRRIKLLVDPAVIWRFLSDRRPWPTYAELVDKLNLPEYDFREWIGVLVTESIDLYGFKESDYYQSWSEGSLRPYPYGSQGSEYYRNSPGAESTRGPGSSGGGRTGGAPSGSRRGAPGGASGASAAGRGGVDTTARDGLPDECVGLRPGQECPTRFDELACRQNATAILNLGKAYLAAGNVREARRNLQLANDEGRKCQAEAARQAARLLQALNLTCEYSEASLARISRDARNNPEGGLPIRLRALQSALAAHGHYSYRIDGKFGPRTRDAVRKFQADYGFDQTGDLTPIETVYLICSAAEVKSQARSMNTLGFMYMTGLGVVQNTDAGLDWLKKAERQGDPLAKFNLAMIYGTGTIESSYKLCDVAQNFAIADGYLEEAADLGYHKAEQMYRDYLRDTRDVRWRKINKQLEDEREFRKLRMTDVGQACRPNP